MTTQYKIEMISRISDSDCTLSGVPAENVATAKKIAPYTMARPDLWLVCKITDEATEQVVYDGSEG